MPIAARLAAGIEACVISAGCSIRLSTPPRLSASAKSWQRSKKSPAARFAPVQHGRDHAAEAVHLSLCDVVLRMAGQARIVDPRDVLATRPATRRSASALAQCRSMRRAERLQAAQRQKAVERSADSADRVLQKAELLFQLLPLARPRRCRRSCRSGRSDIWSPNGRRCRSRDPAAAGCRAWQTCCRPR